MRSTAASLIAIVLGTSFCGPAVPAIAATMTYQGSGTYDGDVLQMTLANGETVTGVRVDALATISTSPPALLHGRCMGMGLIPAEGEERDYETEFYCTFRQNEQDGFDIKGIDKVGGGSVEILGGSGKWAARPGPVPSSASARKSAGATSATSSRSRRLDGGTADAPHPPWNADRWDFPSWAGSSISNLRYGKGRIHDVSS